MADSLLPQDHTTPTKEEIIAKWKDKPQEELLAAKAESDIYINTLTARLDDLRKDYLELRDQQQTGAQLKEFLDRMENRSSEPNTQQITPQSEVQPGIKPEEIQDLVAKEIARNNQLSRQTKNFSDMQAKLRETFGDNYEASYKQRLDTLGLSPEFADDLARNHPTVFMKTLELDARPTQQIPNPIRNTQRPTTFAPQTPKRDWNYYQNLKKENPRLYLDPKIAIQMHEDAMALGDDFGVPPSGFHKG
mgnify:CR=1 FL=1